MNKKVFNYRTLAIILRSLSDSCMRAWEQQQRGETVTACGMTDEEIEDLCEDYLPNLLNPMMSTEEVKQRLGVSDATLNRMVARGELPNGQSKRRRQRHNRRQTLFGRSGAHIRVRFPHRRLRSLTLWDC